ncbi:MAG: Gfo/Idh/MocA family oxidoreductase, partial [Elusimicrobia bacterium]|nr:Gfo/Idh/MocA family oxidoreductase [Elusimicrobiota bacterium]
MTESSKIRVAVVGAGKMGTYHAKLLGKTPDVELVGVCDTNVWKAQLAAWQSNSVAVRDYKDVLGRVDAVVVAVPTPMHHAVGMAALSAGAHVLIEKPLASTV